MIPAKLKTQIIKLHQKKYRKLHNEFLVEGVKGIEEALKKNAKVLFLVVAEDAMAEVKIGNLIKSVKKSGIEVYSCDKKDINKIKNTVTYPGITAVVKSKNFDLKDLLDGKPILAFDKISDPGNLGTIIRTAEWFGLNNFLLSEDSVDPYNDKSVRSTMGSIFNAKLYLSEDFSGALKKLKSDGYKIVLLDIEGEDLNKMKPTKKTVYLFGSESHGLSPALEKFIDKRYTIKGKGDAESLNLSISAGILLSKLYGYC